MSANLAKIGKKLTSLRQSKEREEQKYKELSNKLTEKYNETLVLLKNDYETKISSLKKEHSDKMSKINDDINFYEKQEREVRKLEMQLDELNKALVERNNKKSPQPREIQIKNPIEVNDHTK